MAIDKNKLNKQREDSKSVLDGIMGKKEEPTTTPPEPQNDVVEPPKEETPTVEPTKAEEPIKAIVEPEKVVKNESKGKSVMKFKTVPDEKKDKRKNIVLYPSLCKEVERIAKRDKTSFNDLVNQILLEYANEHSEK